MEELKFHMTNMAPCSYMVKTLKHLLWNQKANDLESWYAASGNEVQDGHFSKIIFQG